MSMPEFLEWQTFTWRRHSFTTTFQGEISALRESEEVRTARLVFPQILNEGSLDQATSALL